VASRIRNRVYLNFSGWAGFSLTRPNEPVNKLSDRHRNKIIERDYPALRDDLMATAGGIIMAGSMLSFASTIWHTLTLSRITGTERSGANLGVSAQGGATRVRGRGEAPRRVLFEHPWDRGFLVTPSGMSSIEPACDDWFGAIAATTCACNSLIFRHPWY
jgi:hypothetical protein